MPATLLDPHIETPPGAPARLRRRPRVRVAQVVMDHLAFGWSVEEMCRQHPDLTPSDAHAAMPYDWDHRDEIDAEIRAEWDQSQHDRDAASPSPFLARYGRAGGPTQGTMSKTPESPGR